MRIRPAKVNGADSWCLDARKIGQGRKFFATKKDAEAEMETLSLQVKLNGQAWLQLSPSQRVDMLSIAEEATKAGLTLRQVWEAYKSIHHSESRTLEKAIEDIIDAKREAGRREVYVLALERTLNAFAKGREQTAVGQITSNDVAEWLSARKDAPQTRQSNQSRISTLFEFCLRKGYIPANPCRRLESISIEIEAPRILTVDQCKTIMCWTSKNKPTMLAWLTLSLFVGLRPRSEADNLTWKDIDLSYKRIHIKASQTKVRTHRIIDLTLVPNSAVWLTVSKKKSPLPVSYTTRRRYIRRLRKLLGFKAWPADILRHSAASYLFALHQDAGKVAAILGNSAAVLLRRYKALVVKEEAAKFFAILPTQSATSK